MYLYPELPWIYISYQMFILEHLTVIAEYNSSLVVLGPIFPQGVERPNLAEETICMNVYT